jgi:carbamoyl-phosphate synthase large subunit
MKILITAIGGDIGQSIAKILRRNFKDIYLIGSDTNIDNAGKFFVDKIVNVPAASDENYIEQIEKIYKKENLDLVIPVNEKEIFVLIEKYNKTNISIVLPKANNIKSYFDKLDAYMYFKDIGIDLPWTVSCNSVPLDYPCILKPRKSSGSKGVKIITSYSEYRLIKNKSSDCILQELLGPYGEEYTCGVYRKIKETYVIIMKRKLQEGGLTGFAEIVKDNEIFKYCELIASKIDLFGSINIQLIKTKTGPKLFEINPRFSSTVIFRDYAGFKDLIWCLNDRLGIDNNINYKYEQNIGKKFYRIYDERYE